MSKIAIIGSGFSGLSASAYLSAAGHEVHVYEKNGTAGGRARQLRTDNGYVFDMGPSWYWMPDVFERFFEDFGGRVSDYYPLQLMDPAFEIVFNHQETIKVPAEYEDLKKQVEAMEIGGGKRLDQFMKKAQYKYESGMKILPEMPGVSFMEIVHRGLLKEAGRWQLFSSLHRHVSRYFSNPQLVSLMEFPSLFLGGTPRKTPALYSLMNYAGLKLGTFYPSGGFGKVVEAVKHVGEKQGVIYHFNSPVTRIAVTGRIARGLVVNGEMEPFDALIASADYHHVETDLLPADCRNYSESYWKKRTMAPSCLIYYVGLSKKIDTLSHHTLFFEEDYLSHAREIYRQPKWPSRPLFYVCCPSRSDAGVAPEGHENLFFLMPVAPGLADGEWIREKYFKIMVERLQEHVGENLTGYIDYKKNYCVSDFVSDYHSYRGNAYGLANTLRQTAFMRPKMINRRVRNLFYTGQLTVPGPGVPPSLISGKMAAGQLLKFLNNQV